MHFRSLGDGVFRRRRRLGSRRVVKSRRFTTTTLLTVAASIVAGTFAAAPANADGFYGGYWVYGAIEQEYLARGGPGVYGNPITAEANAAYGGKFQVFERASSFYWHPDTGAKQVGGRIRDKWRDFGWETGDLHYPTTSETPTPSRQGAFNHFQGGSIYWSPQTDAHQIWGLVRDQWASAGWENSPYGFPKTDEYRDTSYEDTFRQDFEQGSIIVADMKVPLQGYVDPTIAQQGETSPQTNEGQSTGAITAPNESDAPSTSAATPSVSAGSKTTQTHVPTPGVTPPPSGQRAPGQMGTMTWPFGDFCVLGTYGGPGGACRLGGEFLAKDAACVAAIVVEAVSLALTASKILKVRQFIKDLGGAKEAWQLWKGATTKADRAAAWAETGTITKELATEFLGLAAIERFCR
ncbi:MAG: hypothetical protein GX610_10970 [Rhodococcus sp.]|nr:hypothetical protein [Rhodococcus sp. (in: high G+C Gram-positive bacteria)]